MFLSWIATSQRVAVTGWSLPIWEVILFDQSLSDRSFVLFFSNSSILTNPAAAW
jgi:hypothetical protein